MSEKQKLFDFLQAGIEAATDDSPLYNACLRFTHFDYTDEDDVGLLLSNVVSDPAGAVEYDARLIVTTYVRIGGVERNDRYEEYELSKALALKVSELIYDDDSLGGRTCRTIIGKLIDDVDDQLSAGQRHAVNNLYVTINWSGKPLPEPWGGT